MRLGAVLFGCLGGAALCPIPALAQTYVGVSAEKPADALARNMKILATSPRNLDALIGAGQAALAIGDTQAAAGFFGRAEEVSPRSPLPQIGKGAALAHEGDSQAALQYFARAQQLGATQSMMGLERGLAYDLTGNHGLAQADYRTAMMIAADADEARRRLSLSLAISGKKAEALSILAPLMAKGDAAGARCRAFVLALTGDAAGARTAIEAAMPGSSARMAYFFQKLPTLRSDQKAAAVHLGMFPDTAQLASVAPAYSAPAADRLSSIDELLASSRQAPAAAAPVVQQAPRAVQVASITPTVRRPQPTVAKREPDGLVTSTSRHWVQLASGPNVDALPDQFQRIKRRNRQAFDGISGYVTEDSGRARLLIGPFKDGDDAQSFASDLSRISVNAFSWTNQPGQIIRKLPSE